VAPAFSERKEMSMNANHTPGDDMIRAYIYKALAECYYPPGEATLELARQLGRALNAVCPAAAEAAMRSDESLEELAIDHARLFVGPFALLAPPYGSVYLEAERRLMDDSTLAVSERYHEVGLEVAAGFNGTPDHIAAELEFMHVLVVKDLDTLSGGDPVRARRYRRKQLGFLERYLAPWVPAFSRSVEEHAQTSFYKDIATATRMFVESDLELARKEAADGSH
jgi:TorA maturation chaperone TorD